MKRKDVSKSDKKKNLVVLKLNSNTTIGFPIKNILH